MKAVLMCGCKGDWETGKYEFCPYHRRELASLKALEAHEAVANMENELILKINRLAGS